MMPPPNDKVVAVDLDGVVFDFHGTFSDYLREHHDPAFSVEKWTKFPWPGGTDEAIFEAHHQRFIESGGYEKIPIMDGALQAITTLRGAGYFPVFVTARPKELFPVTQRLLETNLLGDNFYLLFPSCKEAYLAQYASDYDMVVDDSPLYIEAALQGRCPKVAMVNHTYNRKYKDTFRGRFFRDVRSLGRAVHWLLSGGH